MRTLAEQPLPVVDGNHLIPGNEEFAVEKQSGPESQMSFDPLASINRLRFDIKSFGYILPETKQQVFNEELSYLAEGADKAAHTTFALRREEGRLVYFDRGQWRPYDAMLQTGLEVAKREADEDPRRSFLHEWAVDDRLRGAKMSMLQPGEQMSWTSSFRHDIAERYGKEFMNNCGLNAERMMGFIYQATGTEDGVILESHTVDLSDPDGFAAVDAVIETEPGIQLNGLIATYDGVLEEKHGEPHFAGRTETEINENAWTAVLKEKELTDYFLQELESIAHGPLHGMELEKTTKRLVYGVWAAFKERLDGNHVTTVSGTNTLPDGTVSVSYERGDVAQEVQRAFDKFASEGRVLIGCGGSIDVLEGESIFSTSVKEVHSAIFGDKVCQEIKDGQATTCPGCKQKVKAIVPNRSKVYCPDPKGYCKLAAPGVRRTVEVSGDKTSDAPTRFSIIDR